MIRFQIVVFGFYRGSLIWLTNLYSCELFLLVKSYIKRQILIEPLNETFKGYFFPHHSYISYF
jgi:hypothetical protein